MRNHSAAVANRELTEVLSRAAARTDTGSAPFNVPVPAHIRCAQAMLEMAVEWRLPAVEQWAVAWLAAAGGAQLRIRWSSRSRDGRFRREAQASGRIVSITGDAGRVILGLSSGAVESWAEDGALQPLLPSTGSPVWAVAARDGRLVAAGPGNTCEVSGWAAAPPQITPPRAGLKAAALSPGGHIAVGAEGGYLRTWAPGGSWDLVEAVTAPARAIAFAGPGSGLIRAVWESGEVSELDRDTRTWRPLYRFPDQVRAAAWTRAGTMLAVATGQEVWLVSPGESGPAAARLLWTQPGVGAVAWSPDDILASASQDQIYASTDPVRPSGEAACKSITTDELIEAIALPDSGHVVSVQDNHLVQWELGNAGSDDPTFFAGDRITALGIAPEDRRVTLVGTERGRLREYSATGGISRDTRLPGGPKVTQIGWHGGTSSWLVASLDGLYQYRPGEDPQLAIRGLFQHVAVGGGRFVYATRNRVSTSDGQTFTMQAPVAGLYADGRGTFAAIDEDGHVLAQQPGGQAIAGPRQEEGTRLLGIDGDWLLLQEYDGRISSVSPWGSRSFGRLPAALLSGARFDQERIVVAYEDEGILLARAGLPANSWVRDRVRVMTVSADRIAVATPNHLAGYDVLDAGGEDTGGSVPLRVQSEGFGYRVTLPTGEPRYLAGAEVRRAAGAMLGDRQDNPAGGPATVRELSEAVYQAGRLGDALWHGGLDLAIDRARGPDPNRPVRLEWRYRDGDAQADRFPWELLHPSTAPLGWFDSPEITSVRVMSPITPVPGRQGFAAGASPTMLVVRGTAAGMDAVDDAFDRFRRRTRRTDLRLLAGKPRVAGTADGFAEALASPADIVQLWMHSGETGVRLSDKPEYLPTALVADLLAGRPRPPRLVVLVGCSSGTLARALIERGVLAVVAMRVPVFDHTVQPLVEDFTAVVLSGVRVDLAFARALRRYLLTGQPGAAAVPMLYIAENADSTLFRGAEMN